MKVGEIKQAVDDGKIVHWANEGYFVLPYGDDYCITCAQNGHTIGLTWRDGKTLNGNEEDFYIENNPSEREIAIYEELTGKHRKRVKSSLPTTKYLSRHQDYKKRHSELRASFRHRVLSARNNVIRQLKALLKEYDDNYTRWSDAIEADIRRYPDDEDLPLVSLALDCVGDELASAIKDYPNVDSDDFPLELDNLSFSFFELTNRKAEKEMSDWSYKVRELVYPSNP